MEVWCPSHNSRDDLRAIVSAKLPAETRSDHVDVVVDFCLWFPGHKASIRDITTWTSFVSTAVRDRSLDWNFSLVQGACLVFFDGLQTNREDKEIQPIVPNNHR
jgi:midasin (ATPase involved in ribosome maturation)